MVKSAYSSGKPSYGVGPGNVQGLYDLGIDIPAAVQKAVNSRILNIVHSQYPWFIMIVVRAIAPLGYAHTNQHPPFK